jgi:uncharacterized membrane protein
MSRRLPAGEAAGGAPAFPLPYRLARLLLAGAGLAISAYLTALHYDRAIPLVCTAGGRIDCGAVLTSPSSQVFGLPVALFGVAWFFLAGTLVLAHDRPGAPAWLRHATLAWMLAGCGAVVYLVYAELALVGHICLWCTAVHVLVLALFVLQALAPPRPADLPDEEGARGPA